MNTVRGDNGINKDIVEIKERDSSQVNDVRGDNGTKSVPLTNLLGVKRKHTHTHTHTHTHSNSSPIDGIHFHYYFYLSPGLLDRRKGYGYY